MRVHFRVNDITAELLSHLTLLDEDRLLNIVLQISSSVRNRCLPAR